MNGCRNSENVGQVEELLQMTEQMQDELDQKDQTIQELNRQLSESLTLNEKLNSENRAENIEALWTRLRQTEERLISETDNRKRADAEVVAWKFKYEKAEQEKGRTEKSRTEKSRERGADRDEAVDTGSNRGNGSPGDDVRGADCRKSGSRGRLLCGR